jgi:hypothetical protein
MRRKQLPEMAVHENSWHQFALEQLGRSFSLLRKRSPSQDPQLTTVMLLCCLLFGTREFILGQYDTGFMHLRSGLRILKASKTLGVSYQASPTEQQCLLAVFIHMDHQAAYFGLGDPILGQGDENEYQLPCAAHCTAFHNIQEAREVLEHIARDVVRFATLSATLSDMEILLSKQGPIVSQMSRFAQTFETFRQKTYNSLSPKDNGVADLTQLKQYALILTLKTCLLPPNDPAITLYTSDFKHIYSFAEAIMSRNPKFPSITMDTGIFPPLYIVANRYPDHSVRWRAIKALLFCSHREGPWDANLLARIAAECMKLESKGAVEPQSGSDHVTQDLHPCKNLAAVSEDRRYVRMPYRVGNTEKNWWFRLDGEGLGSSIPGKNITGRSCVIPSPLPFLAPIAD